MRLDIVESRQEIRAGEIAGGDGADGLAFIESGNARDEIVLAACFPDFHTRRQCFHRLAGDTDAFADLSRAIFGLVVADNSTTNDVAIFVENPERIESGFKGVL